MSLAQSDNTEGLQFANIHTPRQLAVVSPSRRFAKTLEARSPFFTPLRATCSAELLDEKTENVERIVDDSSCFVPLFACARVISRCFPAFLTHPLCSNCLSSAEFRLPNWTFAEITNCYASLYSSHTTLSHYGINTSLLQSSKARGSHRRHSKVSRGNRFRATVC